MSVAPARPSIPGGNVKLVRVSSRVFPCSCWRGTLHYEKLQVTMSYPLAPGIRFNDCVFSEPLAFASGNLPRCAGLFVILAEDYNWAPKPFDPVWFGEFGNNAPAAALLDEAHRSVQAGPGKKLYLAVFALPFSTTAQRWALLAELTRAYN